MNRALTLASAVLFATVAAGILFAAEPSPPTDADHTKELGTRAELLHDVFCATLQLVHQRYYREDEGLPIPAVTFKQVFAEVEDLHQIKLRWLAVDARPMNSDHQPRDEFERQAVKVLASGESEYARVEGGVYRRAATVPLTNECLKCHAPNRNSTADRSAALVIEFPIEE